MTSRRKNGFETGFETGFWNLLWTGRMVLVVWMVERSKRENGSKRSQGNDEMEDVSHCKTMPLTVGKKIKEQVKCIGPSV